MCLRLGILDESEYEPAVGARHQLLAAAPPPQSGERRRRDAEGGVRTGDVYGNGEREETGGVKPGMGDEQRVVAGSDAVETEAAAAIGLGVPRAAAHPHIGVTERSVR